MSRLLKLAALALVGGTLLPLAIDFAYRGMTTTGLSSYGDCWLAGCLTLAAAQAGRAFFRTMP